MIVPVVISMFSVPGSTVSVGMLFLVAKKTTTPIATIATSTLTMVFVFIYTVYTYCREW